MPTEQFDDMDIEYATAVSSRAIDSMSKLSVPATPNNYTVWFHYMLGTSPALRKTIDILLGNRRKFDGLINRELYTAFVDPQSPALPIADLPHRINKIIDSARRFLEGAIAGNNAHMAALDEVCAGIDADSDPRPIIETLISELTKANSRASGLEARLLKTSHQLETVRLSLAESEQRSQTDTLTGLANRRSLDEFLRTSMIRAMETGEPLGVFMLDVDRFKNFNDTHGHLVGDQVLRLVANVLQSNIRETDLAARYGGEELLAVLPATDFDTCEQIAERVRRRISDAKLKRRSTGQQIGTVTVSIGVTQFRLAESAEAVIGRCDRALYRAKNQGRNRVVADIGLDDGVAA